MARPLPMALAPLGLFLFSLPVLLIGATILWALAMGGTDTFTAPADAARRAAYSLPLTLHVVAGMAMLVLGILQITPAFRRRYLAWHRWSGRALVIGGLGIAFTGLFMNASAAAKPDSLAYDAAQAIAALALIGCLAAGIRAIKSRSVARHRVWMVRAYALSLGAATQTVALLPVFLIFGQPGAALTDTVLIAAWPLNLAVAEYFLRKNRP